MKNNDNRAAALIAIMLLLGGLFAWNTFKDYDPAPSRQLLPQDGPDALDMLIMEMGTDGGARAREWSQRQAEAEAEAAAKAQIDALLQTFYNPLTLLMTCVFGLVCGFLLRSCAVPRGGNGTAWFWIGAGFNVPSLLIYAVWATSHPMIRKEETK